MLDSDLPPEPPPRGAGGSFLGSVNVVMLTYIADGALALATGVLIARVLGPDGRGAYGLFVLTAAFTQLLLGLGVGNAALYYLNRGELAMRETLAAAHSVTVGAAALTAAGIAITYPWLREDLLGGGLSPWLLAGAVPALLHWNLMRMLLQAESRFADLAIATLSQQVLLLAAVSVLAAASDPAPGDVAACFIVATGAAGGISLMRVGLRHVDVAGTLRPRLATIRMLAGFGIKGESGNMLQLLNYRLDQYIVRSFVGLAGVGVYAVSASLTEAMFVVANAVALVLLPRMTADEEEARWVAPLATRNTIAVAGAGALGLGAIAPVLIPLAFGDAYRDSVEALWILLPGTILLAGSKVLTTYIFSVGRPLVNTAITGLALIVTVAANFAFVPALGVNGAALASSLAYAAHFAFALFAFSRLSGRPPLSALIPGREDIRLYDDVRRSLLSRRGAAHPEPPA